MNERKGRIEEWDDSIDLFWMVESDGSLYRMDTERINDYGVDFCRNVVAQGNTFYDRENAELAARKRATQVKWERLCSKSGVDPVHIYLEYPNDVYDEVLWEDLVNEMGEDMELLK